MTPTIGNYSYGRSLSLTPSLMDLSRPGRSPPEGMTHYCGLGLDLSIGHGRIRLLNRVEFISGRGLLIRSLGLDVLVSMSGQDLGLGKQFPDQDLGQVAPFPKGDKYRG